MKANRAVFFRCLAWILTGIALDAAAFVGFWVLLDAAGPLDPFLERWLELVGFAAIVWYVHVVALPTICRVRPVVAYGVLLLAWGIGFTATAAMLVPIVGMAVLSVLGLMAFLILALVSGQIQHVTAAMVEPINQGTAVVLMATATIAGAVIGWLGHFHREAADGEFVARPCGRNP